MRRAIAPGAKCNVLHLLHCYMGAKMRVKNVYHNTILAIKCNTLHPRYPLSLIYTDPY